MGGGGGGVGGGWGGDVMDSINRPSQAVDITSQEVVEDGGEEVGQNLWEPLQGCYLSLYADRFTEILHLFIGFQIVSSSSIRSNLCLYSALKQV